MEVTKPRFEVADIFNLYGEQYKKEHNLPYSHLKVMQNIHDCRTSALGGHLERCDNCAYERPVYNSCCNRHCPKCQTMAKEKWVEARKKDLLPVPYFHGVFTLPHQLNPLILCNKAVILKILFQATAGTLLQFGKDPEGPLSGEIGFLAILHTWSQNILAHFHLHCVIPGGALSKDGSFIQVKNGYIFPVKALSVVFRSKFVDLLEKAYDKGKLIFPGNTAIYSNPFIFKGLILSLLQINWVVYAKKPFAGPEQVLDYLGRYTHKVAITNNRILSINDGEVTFSYKDRQNHNESRQMPVPASEFIRRFLLHVLPDGFMRIRAYGFLANRSKRSKLPLCRKALNVEAVIGAISRSTKEIILEITGEDITLCPKCKKGRMLHVMELPKISDPNPQDRAKRSNLDSS